MGDYYQGSPGNVSVERLFNGSMACATRSEIAGDIEGPAGRCELEIGWARK